MVVEKMHLNRVSVDYRHPIYIQLKLCWMMEFFCCWCSSGGLDLILMPGVAFTQNGGRCGHGMGYYDKFLQEHFNKNPHRQRDPSQSIEQKLTQKETVLLGLALNEQIVDEVPLDATDVLLDGVVTAWNKSFFFSFSILQFHTFFISNIYLHKIQNGIYFSQKIFISWWNAFALHSTCVNKIRSKIVSYSNRFMISISIWYNIANCMTGGAPFTIDLR